MVINNILYTMTNILRLPHKACGVPLRGFGKKEVKYGRKLCRNNAKKSESQQAGIPGDEPVY